MTKLKYLFEAHFNDGTMIQQTQEDVSQIDPTRSAFYDVVQRLEDVVAFGLFSDEDPHTYVVDLQDGHFEVGGISFTAQGASSVLPTDTKYRLVYYRRNVLEFNIGMEQKGHYIAYHIGWHATVDGKNFQQTIAVD